MSFQDTSLYLVNRTLRQSAFHEAFDREEDAIRRLASEGMDVWSITQNILATRHDEQLATIH